MSEAISHCQGLHVLFPRLYLRTASSTMVDPTGHTTLLRRRTSQQRRVPSGMTLSCRGISRHIRHLIPVFRQNVFP